MIDAYDICHVLTPRNRRFKKYVVNDDDDYVYIADSSEILLVLVFENSIFIKSATRCKCK